MAGEVLHEFDCDLCDYVVSNVRQHLRAPRERPRVAPNLGYSRWHRLTMPEWLGDGVAALPELLADHVWKGVGGEPAVLPLNDAELNALAGVADDPPMRCEHESVWEPYPALHRR